jgi:hypothetical protein
VLPRVLGGSVAFVGSGLGDLFQGLRLGYVFVLYTSLLTYVIHFLYIYIIIIIRESVMKCSIQIYIYMHIYERISVRYSNR